MLREADKSDDKSVHEAAEYNAIVFYICGILYVEFGNVYFLMSHFYFHLITEGIVRSREDKSLFGDLHSTSQLTSKLWV